MAEVSEKIKHPIVTIKHTNQDGAHTPDGEVLKDIHMLGYIDGEDYIVWVTASDLVRFNRHYQHLENNQSKEK
tara:strand:- start:4565 stop:4783 length:219 start_codon:yes stop_codon:yes gene_type:complete